MTLWDSLHCGAPFVTAPGLQVGTQLRICILMSLNPLIYQSVHALGAGISRASYVQHSEDIEKAGEGGFVVLDPPSVSSTEMDGLVNNAKLFGRCAVHAAKVEWCDSHTLTEAERWIACDRMTDPHLVETCISEFLYFTELPEDELNGSAVADASEEWFRFAVSMYKDIQSGE